MSDFDTDIQVTPADELASLKQRADMMGITYHPSIGLEKLREKVNAALVPKEPEVEETKQQEETLNQKIARLKKEAMKLVRIRLVCMNPAKGEWDGEFISAGNSAVGTVTKYVPFNADEGWHVPYIIYLQLLHRKCQTFYTTTDSRGNKTRRGKLINEFSIEVLPDLTKEELHELAQRQAMSKSID